MDEFDLPPDPALPAQPKKGRGAAENVAHRFSSDQRMREDDGWWQEEEPAPRTELFTDTAKTVISRNDSPDLGFNQSINPYRGCEHGCIYCYARPTHAWLGLSPGLDFEQKIFHKPDVVARLTEELAKPGYRCSPIALGTATDVYQPFERKLGLTRGLLETLLACHHPVTVVTKSALVLRDIDLWLALAQQRLGAVIISLTSLDNAFSRKLEPRASTPAARLKTIETLAAAGIPVTVFIAPLIPGLNDHELEKLLAASQAAGASSASYTLLRLPHEVAGLFGSWLEQHAPEKAARVMHVLYDMRGGKANDANFGSRMKGLGHYAELIRQRFELTARKLGLDRGVPALSCEHFTPPMRVRNGQLSLF
ncbi:MAG TPA: PA0069 family radical SAM protein [Rhodocyclaceae bacterium]|nr:PA0069 family radical SAM protein [Rhodocyclaceae bacterium]